jgi:phage I-like protein
LLFDFCLGFPREKANQKSKSKKQRVKMATDNGQGTTNSRRHLAVLLNGPGRELPRTENRGPRHEIPICVAGSWVKDGYQLSITPGDLSAMVRNFDKRKNDQVVIDYEHASEQPDVARGGPVPAAGWIHQLSVVSGQLSVAKGNGHAELRAQVEWTPEAEQMIRSGQYRFFSPAIDWNYSDKTTGELQGATLTSGALTNHPFLEELPPIMLTDLVGAHGHAPLLADVSRSLLSPGDPGEWAGMRGKFNGGNMADKSLKLKKLEGGGHGVFDGEDQVGHVAHEHLCDYAETELGYAKTDGDAKGQAGIEGHQEPDTDDKKLSEVLRESGFVVAQTFRSAAVADQIREGLTLAATHQLVEQREASRNQLLSLLSGPSSVATDHGPRTTDNARGWFDSEKAKVLLRENKINAADLLDAIEAKGMLDDAVTKCKILPRDRAFFFEIAFNHPKKFSEYIAGAVPVVRLGTTGIGDAQQLPVDQEVDIETKKLMSEKKLSYGKAMKEVFRANPQLEDRYRAAHRQEVRADSPIASAADKMAASDGITQ